MPTFKLTLAYDGTNYVGWQRQAAGTSVQGVIEEALRELDGREVTLHGAGRTDVRVMAAQAAPPDFHARFDAVGKTYRYRIYNADALNPFERHFAWFVFGA